MNMIVTQIDQIDNTTFNRMYASNKTQLISNIGFDDIEIFRNSFNREDNVIKFKAVNESNEVVAYFVGEESDVNTAYMYNMITQDEHTLPLTIEGSANILKSLGYTHVEFCVKVGTGTYDYTKNSMYRPDLYEYESEIDIGNYHKTKLRLV